MKPILLIVSILFLCVLAPAEENTTRVPLKNSILNLPKNLKTWGVETFSKENAVALTGILGMTGIQVATDFESWQAARFPIRRDERFRVFSNYGVSQGDGFYQFALAGTFLGYGWFNSDNRAWRTAEQIVEAIFATGIIVQVIKHTTGRESPFSSEDRTGVWRTFPNQIEYHKDFQKYDAVPSGHLSTATTTFIVIQENYPEQKWIPYVGYPILGWIAIGLTATSIHWVSDYPIALAIGYQFGKIVTRRNQGVAKIVSPYAPIVLPARNYRGEPIVAANWLF